LVGQQHEQRCAIWRPDLSRDGCANADDDAYGNPDRHTDLDSYTHRHADGYGHAHFDRHSHQEPNCWADGDSLSHADACSDSDGFA
jgi:hypothetical protein